MDDVGQGEIQNWIITMQALLWEDRCKCHPNSPPVDDSGNESSDSLTSGKNAPKERSRFGKCRQRRELAPLWCDRNTYSQLKRAVRLEPEFPLNTGSMPSNCALSIQTGSWR